MKINKLYYFFSDFSKMFFSELSISSVAVLEIELLVMFQEENRIVAPISASKIRDHFVNT